MNLEIDMKRDMVTISDNGTVNASTNVQMRDFEIAELFGVMLPTVKGKIRTLLKSRHFKGCVYDVVSGGRLIRDYFDFEMVVAIAFSVDSYRADLFRKWILSKAIGCKLIVNQIFIRANNETSVKTLN